jgi:steroid Delta-isomerase
MQADERFSEIAHYFETLTPESTQAIAQFYSADCYFKDPFNEVRGVEHTKRIFLHMFSALIRPHFVVTGKVVQGNEAFLVWDFVFEMPRFLKGEQRVRGTSHLKLAGDGRVSFHRDYWDAAEELYEKLPILGALMRLLKRQNRVT